MTEGMFQDKLRLETHLGVELNVDEYLHLSGAMHENPLLPWDMLLLLLRTYQRGYENGYETAKFDWQAE